jgi:hypothetical protein
MYAITDQLAERLSKARFHIRTGAQLRAEPISFVASKTKFVLFGFVLMSTHIVVLEKDAATANDIEGLCDTGFKLARRINWVPLPRGFQFGYSILPLIVGKNPDPELLLCAASPPELRWGVSRFPVVVDLTENQVAFFEGFKKLGAAHWPILQKIVIEHIEPLVDETCETGQARDRQN